MLPGRYFTDSGNLATARHSYSPVEVHVSECVTCVQRRRFGAIPESDTSGWVPSRIGNARWVSRCDVMLPGRYWTDSGNMAVARHSHSPVEVHASECGTCVQRRRFGPIPESNTLGWVPSRLRNARWMSRCAHLLPGRYWMDSGHLAFARKSHSPVNRWAILIGYGVHSAHRLYSSHRIKEKP
jgi:hypothetical protein